jgi:hypothetical protein
VLALDANAERFLNLAREFRARHRLWMGSATRGFRRLSPSAELMVDPESGARCVIWGAGGGSLLRITDLRHLYWYSGKSHSKFYRGGTYCAGIVKQMPLSQWPAFVPCLHALTQ